MTEDKEAKRLLLGEPEKYLSTPCLMCGSRAKAVYHVDGTAGGESFTLCVACGKKYEGH
jgi:hypothetical protein